MNLLYNAQKITELNISPQTTIGQIKTILSNWLVPLGIKDYKVTITFNNGVSLDPIVFEKNMYDDVNFVEYTSYINGGVVSIIPELNIKKEIHTYVIGRLLDYDRRGEPEMDIEVVLGEDLWDLVYDLVGKDGLENILQEEVFDKYENLTSKPDLSKESIDFLEGDIEPHHLSDDAFREIIRWHLPNYVLLFEQGHGEELLEYEIIDITDKCQK